LLTPNRLGAFTEVTRRALIQFSPAIENLIRTDLLTAVAQKLEDVTIEGGGGSDPDGITQTAGIGSVAVTGSLLDWEATLNLEREVDVDNALMGRLAYCTTPAVVSQLKRTDVGTDTGQFIWDRTTPTAPVNSYPCMKTTHVPSDLGAGTDQHACLFGNWADAILAIWDTIEVIVNPFSKDTQGIIRITIQHEVDINVRHAESFAACLDINPDA
jgi:HK97 family phage major capsid protein